MNYELTKNGYIIIKNPLSTYQINNALSCIVDNGNNKTKIDYNKLNLFIDNDFIPRINETLGWSSIYLKYRFSNSQNSKDAATFHGDVYNFADDNIMPIYTGLIYFDDAFMEIVPGSHNKNTLSTNELYEKRIKIKMNPGDVLVFHANIHHRGVFYESKSKNRRLLQVFEIFPNKKIYDVYYPNFLSVLTGQTFIFNNISFLSETISKNKNLDELTTYLHYWLINNELQYKLIMSDITEYQKKGKYVGYVPGLIDTVKEGILQDWNINITHIEHNTIIPNTTIQKITIIIILMVLISSRCNSISNVKSYKKYTDKVYNKVIKLVKA